MGLTLSNGIRKMRSIQLIKQFSLSGNTWLIAILEIERF
jgi:hypothetical protein